MPSALELGGSIGVFTALLAPRCRPLVTLDAAPTAVAAARAHLAGVDGAGHAEVRLGDDSGVTSPTAPFDLVVASEILYYLPTRRARRRPWPAWRSCCRPAAGSSPCTGGPTAPSGR